MHVARACGMTGYCDHYGYRFAEWKSIVTLKSNAMEDDTNEKKKKKHTRKLERLQKGKCSPLSNAKNAMTMSCKRFEFHGRSSLQELTCWLSLGSLLGVIIIIYIGPVSSCQGVKESQFNLKSLSWMSRIETSPTGSSTFHNWIS